MIEFNLDRDQLYGVRPFCIHTKEALCVTLPASKSALNRLLILAALSPQRVTLKASSWGEDTDLMIGALRALGLRVDVEAALGLIHIHGQGGNIPEARADLYFGNAGTVARFISAVLTLRVGGVYTLDGDEAMRKRPMAHLWEALRAVGAVEIDYLGQEGFLPCIFKTKGFAASKITINPSLTSQGLSALMMIGGLKGLEIYTQGKAPSWPFVEMTAKLITDAGGRVEFCGASIRIEKTVYAFEHAYTVPLDATAASYYAAWAISTQRPVCIRPFVRDTEQGDWQFLDLLERLGVIDCRYLKAFKTQAKTLGEEEETATLTLTAKAYDKPIEADFREISDTFLTLLAIGPLLKAPIKLYGLKHTRFQECDRLHAMAHNLQNLGQSVLERDDGIELWPDYEALKQKEAYVIKDYADHRVAMSFAILGSHDLKGNAQPWIYLKKPDLCAKTFPDFFKTLERMHQSA